MNELETVNRQLPETIEDLASWDKFLSARLPAYRKLIHNVKSWEEATEEERRILRRAQEEAENLIDVRVRIGELYRDVPEEITGRPEKSGDNDVRTFTQRQSFKESTGLSDKQAQRYRNLANHPEAVEKAKEDARKHNDVVSQQGVFRIIAADAPSPQTTKQKEAEEIHKAKERHSDYQQKKSEGIVSIQDARQDKQDRKRIAEELYNDLLSITTKSYWISALNTASDFDALADVIPDDRKQSMKDRIEKMMNVLNKVMEVLDESKIRR